MCSVLRTRLWACPRSDRRSPGRSRRRRGDPGRHRRRHRAEGGRRHTFGLPRPGGRLSARTGPGTDQGGIAGRQRHGHRGVPRNVAVPAGCMTTHVYVGEEVLRSPPSHGPLDRLGEAVRAGAGRRQPEGEARSVGPEGRPGRQWHCGQRATLHENPDRNMQYIGEGVDSLEDRGLGLTDAPATHEKKGQRQHSCGTARILRSAAGGVDASRQDRDQRPPGLATAGDFSP